MVPPRPRAPHALHRVLPPPSTLPAAPQAPAGPPRHAMSDVEAGHLSVGHESLDSASDVFGQRNELDCRQRLGDDVDDIMARVQAAASGQAEGSWAQKTESTVFRVSIAVAW